MSLFRRNIQLLKYPQAKVTFYLNSSFVRNMAVIPSKSGDNISITKQGAVYGGIPLSSKPQYWCFNVQRVSAYIDYFRLTTLAPCIIDNVFHDTGYTFSVQQTTLSIPQYIEFYVICLDLTFNNFTPPA